MVKNLLATQVTKVRSLGQEDPLEEEMQPTPAFLPGKSHGQRSLEGYRPWSCKEVDTTEHRHTGLFYTSFSKQNIKIPNNENP